MQSTNQDVQKQRTSPHNALRRLTGTREEPQSVQVKIGRASQLRGFSDVPGHIDIERWNSPEPAVDISTVVRLYGHLRTEDLDTTCSKRTKALRGITLQATFREVARRNRNIKTLAQFTPRLIPQILAYWSEVDALGKPRQSFATQIQNFSVLKWFWKVHGITTEPIKAYIEDEALRGKYSRSLAASHDKSWEGNGVDVEQKIKEARSIDPVVARLLTLARDFGLRAQETISLRPHVDDQGDRLHVSRGTKTGRARDIVYADFGDDAFRQAIEDVKAELRPGEHAAWANRTLKQSRERLYFVLAKIGITKKDSGVTLHGLRAQWAINQLEALTGTTAPIRGGGAINYKALSAARLDISRAMGHNRKSVTTAYFGSFLKMKQVANTRFLETWRLLEGSLPKLQTLLDSLGVPNMWLVGRRAHGANHRAAENFEFLIDDHAHLATIAKTKQDIIELMESELGFPVIVHVAATAGNAAKEEWSENALPLFDVEPPFFEGFQVKMEPPSVQAAPQAMESSSDAKANEGAAQ